MKSNTKADPDLEVPESITNIMGVGGVTRSGKCYTPERLQRATKIMKPSEDPKEKSQEGEDKEFLKIMK